MLFLEIFDFFSNFGHPRAIVEFCYQEEWKKEAVDLYVTYNGGRV